jgi:hypothetical protein
MLHLPPASTSPVEVGLYWYDGKINGGPFWPVPKLLFESKKLNAALQQLLINGSTDRIM